jgi:hypothetical protein
MAGLFQDGGNRHDSHVLDHDILAESDSGHAGNLSSGYDTSGSGRVQASGDHQGWEFAWSRRNPLTDAEFFLVDLAAVFAPLLDAFPPLVIPEGRN